MSMGSIRCTVEDRALIRVVDTILQEAGNCYLYEKMGYHRSGRQTEVNEKMTIVGYEKD